MTEKTHPLDGFELNIKSIKCFTKEGSGAFIFAPITFIIGKNNSGKSTVLDVLQRMSRSGATQLFQDIARSDGEPRTEIAQVVKPGSLKKAFPQGTSGGGIPGQNHWDYASGFLDRKITWSINGQGQASLVDVALPDWNKLPPVIAGLEKSFDHPCSGKWCLRVRAERDVNPEKRETERSLSGNGGGLTNIVRAFINSDDLPRHVVEIELLRDLNSIYLGDGEFTRILCQENEETGLWEIYLREEGKGDIRLSQSGSSLKTAFIVTAFLRLVPLISKSRSMANLIFCIEEPENNLHPALLRRLVEFLAGEREQNGFSLVITTHSAACIDWAAKRKDATILHVRNEEGRTVCRNVLDYGDRISILDDLDVRGSDILQANGVIWVEGPSDRVYIKKWICLLSNNTLKEGSHYSFLYYGGKVLSHFEAMPNNEMSDKIKMLLINRNVAVVMDSDRQPRPRNNRKPRMNLSKTKKRLIEEVKCRDGFSWVTGGKEIENYVPKSAWVSLCGADLRIGNEYVDIPALTALKAIAKTKVDLAHAVEPHISLAGMRGHLDLVENVEVLCSHIRGWNGH